jgi:putative SOS response-associated peptidase YedK
VCYSNSSTSTNVELSRKYNKKIPSNQTEFIYYFASGFTRPVWPVINQLEEIQNMQWGLIPQWFNAENNEIALKTLNCRTETADSKASFKHLINSRRCVIPSTGFFEWHHLGREKKPYYIYSPHTKILSMAGLWDSNLNNLTGEVQNTFTILTTEANEFMSEIHNSKKRMPLFLNSDAEIQEWLSCDSEINHFVKTSKETKLSAHLIDKSILLSSNPNVPEVSLPFSNKTSQLSLF